MASIPDSTIEEIKARTDLADLMSSYGVELKRSGSSYMACCPFHHEKTPSFSVQPDKGFYHCFGCGKSGDAIRFVQEQEGLTFIEAVKKLAQRAGVEIQERDDPQAGMRKRLYELHAELAAFYRRCLLKTREAEKARAYLAERKIPDDVAERFQIGYAPAGAANMMKWAAKYGFTADEMDAAGVVLKPRSPGESGYHRFGGRLVFTIRDRAGRAVAFSCRTLEKDKSKMRGGKYVNSPETLIFKKSNILYALDAAAPNIAKAPGRQAIVCEGQIDVIRCHMCGFPVAVAGQGTAFTKEHVALLKRVADSVVLVYDDDGAGHKAAVRTGGEFLAAEVPVRVATLPEGHDPDSMLLERGPEDFRKCLDAAESITAYQVRTMRAAERNPDSIDAVKRVSRAALETISLCPSAVLRASLMQEAAQLMNLPVSALETDFEKAAEAAREKAASRAAREQQVEIPRHVDEPQASGTEVSVAGPEQDVDASAPVNNPPSPLEMEMCQFLFEHERDRSLAPLLDYMPPAVLSHGFTRGFVDAWRRQLETGEDELAAFSKTLGRTESGWFSNIVFSDKTTDMGDRDAAALFRDFLRSLWITAVRRRIGEMPADSSPENDRARLGLQMLVHVFRSAPWERAAQKMTASVLED